LFATFFPAGHIAESAMLSLESSEGRCYLREAVGLLWQGKD
jgi:Cft2 family RNA processing exonuclease